MVFVSRKTVGAERQIDRDRDFWPLGKSNGNPQRDGYPSIPEKRSGRVNLGCVRVGENRKRACYRVRPV